MGEEGEQEKLYSPPPHLPRVKRVSERVLTLKGEGGICSQEFIRSKEVSPHPGLPPFPNLTRK